MVKYFLDRGGEAVLWVEPYPTRLPSIKDTIYRPMLHNQGTQVIPNIVLVKPHGLPIEPLPSGAWMNRQVFQRKAEKTISEFAAKRSLTIGIGRPSRLALHMLKKLLPQLSFYDAMDDFPAFYSGLSRVSMKKCEDAIAETVGRIFIVSRSLETKFIRRKSDIVYLPNACNMSSLPPPAVRQSCKKVIGYVGTIGKWFDWVIVSELAHALPEIEIHLIGPCFSSPPRKLPKNVLLQGPCPLNQVSMHLVNFSAGIIPFKDCQLTASVDPIKYYEYRALGLPILSTRFGEMERRGIAEGVFFLNGKERLASVAESALNWRPSVVEVAEFRRANDWAFRFSCAQLFGATSDVVS